MRFRSIALSFFTFFLLFIPVLLTAGPREMVCVVRPVLDADIRDSLQATARELDRSNLKEVGDFFRAYSQGGFGSGFLHVDGRGNCFVVTNRHVVAMAQSVTLEFEREDGSSLKYTDCPVIYADDTVDLAVVGFPGGKNPFNKGLPVYKGKISEGDEVWAAGFPALFDNPSWQFSKGNITNKRVTVQEIADVQGTWFIQHSATIDNGNSGGPLLIKDAARNDFSIVGINTWSMAGRQNTFFSIPSAKIVDTVAAAAVVRARTETQNDAALAATCRDFASSFNQSLQSTKNESRFISYSLGARNGLKDFVAVVSSLDKSESEAFDRKLHKGVPIEIFRQATYERMRLGISRSLKDARLEFVKIDREPASGSDGRTARALFSLDGEEIAAEMKWENGHWRILEITMDKLYKGRAFSTPSESPLTGGREYSTFLSINGGMHSWDRYEDTNVMVYSGVLSFINQNNRLRNIMDLAFEYVPSVNVYDDMDGWQKESVYGLGGLYGYGYVLGPASWYVKPVISLKIGALMYMPIIDFSFLGRGAVGLEYYLSQSYVIGLEVSGDARYSFFSDETYNSLWYAGQAGIYMRYIY